MKQNNRYGQIIERIFLGKYTDGAREISFTRDEITLAAAELGIKLPKNLGDLIYSFRYRTPLPESVRSRAPEGHEWIIRPTGRACYTFVASTLAVITPAQALVETKIPDSTPGVIAKYALGDEQALLAKLRYNRLIDIFTGVTCYSLQNHLRSSVPGVGQIETDEVYVGIDKRGCHYVFPVQAKGGSDSISVVQIEQDFALCASRFSTLVCRPIGAQFMSPELIALFAFEISDEGIAVSAESHYRLVAPEKVTEDDLRKYRERLDSSSRL